MVGHLRALPCQGLPGRRRQAGEDGLKGASAALGAVSVWQVHEAEVRLRRSTRVPIAHWLRRPTDPAAVLNDERASVDQLGRSEEADPAGVRASAALAQRPTRPQPTGQRPAQAPFPAGWGSGSTDRLSTGWRR